MSDIVERLRAWEACANGGALPRIPAVRNGEAADEILSLRAENAALRKDAERYRQLCTRACKDGGDLVFVATSAYNKKHGGSIKAMLDFYLDLAISCDAAREQSHE